MATEICAVCGYELSGLSADAACPECGAGAEARRKRSHSRGVFTWLAVAVAAMTLPSLANLVISVVGWFVAHKVIHIRNPHWVQWGEHSVLDVLGIAWLLTFLLTFLSMYIAPVVLVIAVVTLWLDGGRSQAARFRLTAVMIALTFPLSLQGLSFLYPSEIPQGLIDWIPD